MAIIYIILLGLCLRLINLNQSFWFDEAINVVYARDYSLDFYLTKYILGDFHPPSHFFVLWMITHIFGFSEVIARVPSVIFGILTIYFTYLIGKRYSKKVGLIGAILMAVAPLHIYYSQEARPYALGAFAVSVSSYFFLRFIRESDIKTFLLFSLATGLVLYSDYPAYFILPTQLAFLLINYKEKLFSYIKVVGMGLVLFLPVLPIFIHQLILGTNTAQEIPGWASVVGGNSLKNVLLLWIKMLIGRINVENRLLYISASSAISLLYLFVLLKNLKNNYPLLWLILPPIFGIIISLFIPIFSYFRFLYILPAFYLLVALGIERFKGIYLKLVLGLIIILQMVFSLIYLLNSDFHREDWREAVRFLDDQNSLIYFESNEVSAPFKLYSKKNDLGKPGLKKIPAVSSNDLNISLENENKVLLVEYLTDVTDPKRLIDKKLRESDFIKTRTADFRGVGFIHLYQK